MDMPCKSVKESQVEDTQILIDHLNELLLVDGLMCISDARYPLPYVYMVDSLSYQSMWLNDSTQSLIKIVAFDQQ